MKVILFIACLFTFVFTFGQKEITINIENLSKPKNLLITEDVDNIYMRLISDNLRNVNYLEDADSINKSPYNIIYKSKASNTLVYQGYHPFFNGMYEAYANHRPFVISPDMIWLLISQGFARHVNANAERLRSKFVNFSGKTNLVVYHNFKNLESPTNNWDTIIQEFTKKIDAHIGKDLVDILTSDFTTTTQNEKIASQITIMDATKHYFELTAMNVVCGIPEVTLKGTTEDWEKVLNKTKKFAKYDLEWWTSELEPILEEFIDASKGKIHKKFWRNMFKVHTLKQYGNPEQIDGWIVKFFPYDKYDKQNNLKFLYRNYSTLPEEIVKVDLTFISKKNDSTITTPLELWAGFIGLEQNSENFALTPAIGWLIRKKDKNKDLKESFEVKSTRRGGIKIEVKELPTELLELKQINILDISFTDSIIIPEKLGFIKIQKLVLDGLINDAEIERIKKMFPKTFLKINGKTIYNPYANEYNNFTPNLDSIKKYVDEKRQLLNKYLCENDLQKSKELYDTLNKINLKEYTIFKPTEHFYINIILNDWNNLLNLFKNYKRDYRGWNISNELIISNKVINIANKSIENKDIYLKTLKLEQEDEQILEIYLTYFKQPLLNKELNEKISAFKKNYKTSKYDNFINDYFPKRSK